jgi:sigma54-dependent transcription regulator
MGRRAARQEENMAYDSLEPLTGCLAAGFAGSLIGGMQRGAAHAHARAARAASANAAAWSENSGVLETTVARLRARISDYIDDDSMLREEINDLRHALAQSKSALAEALSMNEGLMLYIDERYRDGRLVD